jgi:serine/threonine protein kinase/Tol biopolymer transport system component
LRWARIVLLTLKQTTLFLSLPVFRQATSHKEDRARKIMELTPGTRLGAYEIRHWIGAGGMGEVYFARDTKLGRYVALKLLLPELTADEERVRRFEQEARATSALNHPNILTIFEVGKEGDVHFIVTEFVDGVTLRKLMTEERLPLGPTLDIVIQIAAALSAAHGTGIVHRDIKPENIMLRPDGYVKVLDFGLAKLMPTQDQRITDPNASTALNMTEPGAIVGTVNYMSPEQLRGMKVDGRADIWSLGVVAYEMVAGHPPFNGLSKSDVIAAILRQEPIQLTRYSEDVPQELQRIVAKSLRKDRDERYQIAKDLLIDLKDLRQDLELDAKQGRIRMSDPLREAAADDELRQTRAYTNRIEPAKRTSGAHYLFDEIRQHRVGVTLLSSILLLAFVVSIAWFSGRNTASKPGSGSGPPSATEIMTTSNVREGTISPDGKYIAIVVEDAGKQSIKVQQPYNPGEAPVIADGGEYRGLVFSRDGTSVYYLAKDEKGSALYQVSTLGGAARKLLTSIETPITLSPDGTQLAFVRRNSGTTVLVTAKADGTGERELATAAGQFEFSTFHTNSGPAWSPDGKVIACPTMTMGDPMYMEVVAARVDDGSVKPMSSQRWFLIGQLGWLSDGSGLIMAAQEKTPPQTTTQIWSVTYPGGEARALTSDVGFYQGIGLTADSATLLTTRTNQTSKIWIASISQPDDAEELPASKNKGSGGLVWTSDGNLVYASNESGTMEIWAMNVKGSDIRQMTFDKHTCVEPSISRHDSKFIVFASYATGKSHIWRIEKNGNDLKQLTSGTYEDWPDFSPDGESVIYHGAKSSSDGIWKISINGGTPAPLTAKEARHPVFSPDGKLIACYLRDEGTPWQLAVLPVGGGPPLKTFSIPVSVADQWVGPRWAADGKAISYIVTKGGISNIWVQPVTGEPAKQLTNFNQEQIFAFAWSPDGKSLALVRGVNAKSVVLMKNFRHN